MLSSWLYLIAAIIFEVFGTTCMKLSQGFTQTVPAILIFIFYGLSLTFSTLCLQKIAVSVAYSIWSGLGTTLLAIIGIIWFRESITPIKMISISLVIVGVIGLNSGK
ncbi:MAG: multidrug efflux SMR transporter [Goleter apudmare HA4340-LM2]|jgi:small multidrug resistance pump|nr:multidrug efflux SMR transporter [Goleter apudmare HA4340-LM2]